MSIAASLQEEARRVVEGIAEGLSVGPPRTHAGLTVFPISSNRSHGAARYVTLDHALAGGTFRVTEIGEDGSVPELRVVNDGDTHVLMLDGEELVGAKQNRTLNVSVLAPAKRSIVIPVSCVERGRWAHSGDRHFSSADSLMYAELRRSSSMDMLAGLKAGRGYRSEQAKVWAAIAEKSRRVGSTSGTGAMRGMFQARGADIDGYVRAFEAGDRQVGAAFCVGGRLAGVELFDHPSSLRALLPKLVRSFAMDAIEGSGANPEPPGGDDVEALIGDVARANKEVHAGVGLGEDVRLSAPRLIGGALVFDGAVVHLSAFPHEASSEPPGRPEPRREPAPPSAPPQGRISRSWWRRLRRE